MRPKNANSTIIALFREKKLFCVVLTFIFSKVFCQIGDTICQTSDLKSELIKQIDSTSMFIVDILFGPIKNALFNWWNNILTYDSLQN